jgi:tetratricopeptide (TPR) repeat protein
MLYAFNEDKYNMTTFRFSFRTSVFILAAALLSLAPLAQADTYQDIGKLMKQGQFAQALEKTDQFLATSPKDPQARFMKGLILTELNRTSEAIVVFTKLTEEFPESPEPYNNLAVIYAQQKQYDKAREALETAIRTHPSYATAHENLGDIYAHMASQAYDKALQIDSSNTSAQTKLAMIRDMMTSSRPTTARPTGKPPTMAAATAPPATKAEPVAANIAKPVPASDATASGDTAEINKTVAAWAAAWSKKDVKAYLAFYAGEFETPGGESRADWEAERNKRIDKPGAIEVTVEDVKITMSGADRATVKFHQKYKSAALKSSGPKTLVMVKRDGKWMIKQEQAAK